MANRYFPLFQFRSGFILLIVIVSLISHFFSKQLYSAYRYGLLDKPFLSVRLEIKQFYLNVTFIVIMEGHMLGNSYVSNSETLVASTCAWLYNLSWYSRLGRASFFLLLWYP